MKLVPDIAALPAIPVGALAPPVLGPFTLLVNALRAAALMDASSVGRPVPLFNANPPLRRAGIAIELPAPTSTLTPIATAHAFRYRALPDNVLRLDLRPRRTRTTLQPVTPAPPVNGETGPE